MVEPPSAADSLTGLRVALVGRLAGVTHREAESLLRQQGAIVVDPPDDRVQLIVLGEHSSSRPDRGAKLDGPLRVALEQGAAQVIDETELWRRLGLVDTQHQVQRLYTPRMVAELVGVSASRLRTWRQQGLLTAAREVHRLAYFDFSAVIAARRLKELTHDGLSAKALKATVARLRKWLPQIGNPFAELSLVVVDSQLLVRRGEGLVDVDGQHRLDFEPPRDTSLFEEPITRAEPVTVEDWLDTAAELDDLGDVQGAIQACRAAIAVKGPNAEVCFQLAELFYRYGELPAARERYFMAIELDASFVEARANLGCVLSELGHPELAVAAFEGALAYHPDYPDVHYHLARALDELERATDAEGHWKAFLQLSPDSPWADIARRRLSIAPLV